MTHRDGGGAISRGGRRRTLLGALLLAAWPAAAQEADPTGDIIVTPARTPPPFETRHALGTAAIDRIAANAADEVVRRLPSVYVPVNSRGEAIAFVRGAAERQVAVFYDGAAINVPWDNRLDLSMLPAGLIGRAQVAAAPLAPRYGVSALGAVSFAPARPDAFGARGLVGSGGIRELAGIAPLTVGATDLTIGASYATRAGETVADDAALPFAQAGTLRTNTDRDLASIFAQASTRAGDHRLSFTAFHVAGDKGIAPESDRASGARFWRYPTLRHTLLSGKAGVLLGDTTTLDVIGWYQRFDQTIDSYTDATYRRRDTQEVDRDRTVGTRVLLSQAAGPTRVTASLNLLESVHDQRDTGFTNGAPPLRLPAFLRYRQRNASVGLDTVTALTEQLEVDLGVGYDRVAYVDTGDKPPVDAAEGWTGRAGLAWRPAAGWRLRATLGRKIRAPTMRELFGQALNRFLINPDLRPERVVSAELGAGWTRDDLSLSLVAFAQDLDGTIDQRNVGRLRQRINLPGSTVRGLEATAAWQPAPGWSLGGSATLTRTRRKEPPAGTSDRLAEKPDLLARLYGERVASSGFGLLAELLHVGRAYSADADGVLVALPRSTALNLRVSQRIDAADGAIELFARGDNLTDTAIVPQLGLPAPGRTFRVGLSVRGV